MAAAGLPDARGSHSALGCHLQTPFPLGVPGWCQGQRCHQTLWVQRRGWTHMAVASPLSCSQGPENRDNSELRFYQFYFLDFFCLFFFFILDHAGHMSVLGSAMVCQPEIHKANLATSQSPSKPFMSQGRLRGPTTSLWPFGQNLTPSPWTQWPSRVPPGWDASAELVVPVLVWQLARELGGLQHCSWLRKGRVFTLAQCCN